MAVIPLIKEGENPTVVDTLAAWGKAGGIDGRAVLIQGIDDRQFLPTSRDANVTYDLRVGDQYRDHRDAGGRTLPENGVIKLSPGEAVIIQTMESVFLPKSMFGTIVPRVSLLEEGISNTTSKVDPGYNGRLLVTMFNLGKKDSSLKYGEPFCSLCLFQVGDGARPYDKPAKQIPGEAPLRRGRQILDFLQRYNVIVTLVLMVATFALAVSRIADFIRWLRTP